MKSNKGVTLVALVVTIIVLIILAGISINLILGDNGIITIAKKAKENTELAKIQEETELNELYTQLETEGSNSENLPYDSIAKLTEFKTAIANAIGKAGGIKPDVSAETNVFENNINEIVKEVTKNASATAEDILREKTAYVDGNLISGTMENYAGKTVEASNVDSNDTNIYLTIPNAGYYDKNSKVSTANNNNENDKFIAGYVTASQQDPHYVAPTYVNTNLATVNGTDITVKKDGTVKYYFKTTGHAGPTGSTYTFYARLYKNGTLIASNTVKREASYSSGTVNVNKGDVLKFYDGSYAYWGSSFDALLYYI